jgi:ribosome-binding factor A
LNFELSIENSKFKIQNWSAMSTTFRSDRAAEAIRAAVSKALLIEVHDPRLSKVTITHVEVSRDLQNAKIYYTVLGEKEARDDAERAFQSAKPMFRSKIGEEVQLRLVPEITFRYDGGTDNAMSVEDILNSLPELKKSDES